MANEKRLIDLRALGIGKRNPNAFIDPERACGWNDLLEILETAPTVDAVPVKRGRWIKESDGGTRCSVCNKRVRDVSGGWDEPVDLSDMPYCPKCGARMNEEVNT